MDVTNSKQTGQDCHQAAVQLDLTVGEPVQATGHWRFLVGQVTLHSLRFPYPSYWFFISLFQIPWPLVRLGSWVFIGFSAVFTLEPMMAASAERWRLFVLSATMQPVTPGVGRD
jgi:hypothetical protein